jgi:predicted Rossmann-fold nucleotide-binding protein
MLNKAVKEQFMKEEHAMLWTVADTPEEAVKALLTEQEKHTL